MSNPVRYKELVDFLEDATLHEIYRLSVAIDRELMNSRRIDAVRKQFKVGDVVEYFDEQTNRFVAAVVLEKKIKRVTVKNCEDQRNWRIPYYLLKLNSRDFDFQSKGGSLTRNALKVGDWIGFNHDGREIIGRIKRLNTKTVTLETKDRQVWYAGYSVLYPVIDGSPVVDGLEAPSDPKQLDFFDSE